MADEQTEKVASDTTSQGTIEQTQQTETTTTETQTAEQTEKTGSEPTQEKEPQEVKLRRRAQSAEQEAAYWRGVAEAGGKKPEEPQVRQPEGPPTLDQFENYDDFLIAKAEYGFSQKQEQQRAAEASQRIKDSYNERYRKAIEKHPDLPEISRAFIQNRSIPQNPAMAQAIMESDIGPEIVYHLGQNAQEAIRIASLSPVAAAREIGKIEAKLITAPIKEPNTISQAPEPIKAVGTKGTVGNFDYEKTSMDDFMKKRNTESPPHRR